MSVFLNAAQVMSNDDSNDILKQIVVSLGGLSVEIMDGVAIVRPSCALEGEW